MGLCWRVRSIVFVQRRDIDTYSPYGWVAPHLQVSCNVFHSLSWFILRPEGAWSRVAVENRRVLEYRARVAPFVLYILQRIRCLLGRTIIKYSRLSRCRAYIEMLRTSAGSVIAVYQGMSKWTNLWAGSAFLEQLWISIQGKINRPVNEMFEIISQSMA